MGFTTQCFIHKNTANIRNRLKELGYYCNPYLGWHNLFTCVFGVNSVYSLDDYDTNGLKEIDGLNECGRKIHKATVDELIEHFKTKEEQ